MPIGCNSLGATSSCARVRSGLISVNASPNSLSNGASGIGCMLVVSTFRQGRGSFGVQQIVHVARSIDTVGDSIPLSSTVEISHNTELEEDDMATATTEPVRLPPGPRTTEADPGRRRSWSQTMECLPLWRDGTAAAWSRVNLPHNSHAVVISDPILAKELFSTGTDLVERAASGPGRSARHSAPGRRSALPATSTPSAANCWHRHFTASECEATTGSSKKR